MSVTTGNNRNMIAYLKSLIMLLKKTQRYWGSISTLTLKIGVEGPKYKIKISSKVCVKDEIGRRTYSRTTGTELGTWSE